MKIDPNKKWKSGGKPVSLLHRKPDGWPSPYVWEGVVDGVVESWTENGEYYISEDRCGQDLDLVEVREPREFKLAINREDTRLVYSRGVESLDEKDWEIVRVREIIEP